MVRLLSATMFGRAPAGAAPAFVDLDLVVLGGQPRLLGLMAGGGSLAVFDSGGAELSRSALPGSLGYLSRPQLEVIPAQNGAWVVPFGLTGSRTSVLSVAPTGTLSSPVGFAADSAAPPDLRLATGLTLGETSFVFGALPQAGGLASYRAGSGGTLTPVATASLPQGTQVAALTAAAEPNGRLLACATAGGRPGLHVFDVSDNGGLTLRATLPQITGLGLSDVAELRILPAAGGDSFVIAAGAGSSSLAVFRLTGGGLTVADHVLDSRTTRFEGATALETIQIGARSFVVVSGTDDGVSLFLLLPDGRLLHLQTLEDQLASRLDSGGALALSVAGTVLQVFVASGSGAGITRLSFDIGPDGVQRQGGAGTQSGTEGADVLLAGAGTLALHGGGGDDVLASNGQAISLTGGDGRDIFMLSPAQGTIQITDFDPLSDRIDLTLFPMLRSVAQIGLTIAASGATLRIGETTLIVQPAPGRTLRDADFSTVALLPFDRLTEFRLDLPLQGSEEPDSLTLGLVAAAVSGEGGNDTISGSPGSDTISGGTGADRLIGGSGNDMLAGDSDNDLLQGDTGHDTLEGGAGNDTLQGGRDNDLVSGGTGDDLLSGENGADTLRGGANNDTLWGGAANDQMFGDEGFDTLYGGSGTDLLEGGLQADRLQGDDGHDTLSGGQGFDVLSGNAGTDLLFGGDDQDWMFGGIDNDTLQGGDGPDFLFGGVGFDTIYGGTGTDQIQGEDNADFLHGDDQNDTIYGGQGFDVVSGNADDDLLFGGSEQDWMFGGWQNDTIDGGTGDDFLFCGIGQDTAYGQDGNDFLNGEYGDDLLFGGAGNDTLRSGWQNDQLHGGAGADRFVLTGGGQDRILDFDPNMAGEVIVLTEHALTGGWARLRSTAITPLAEGLRLDLGQGNSLLLAGVRLDALSADDFVF